MTKATTNTGSGKPGAPTPFIPFHENPDTINSPYSPQPQRGYILTTGARSGA
ncbi:hypothetical protein [Brasilonema sp. UFV-L1]|uniref:hypothetical protein n=1 Tax=Brasilonema sp. UFV-L1 TaxID=2234130 RepID=UPI00145F0EB4|nr:hypothetical protein [Brasilonema sp. UFV-L1]